MGRRGLPDLPGFTTDPNTLTHRYGGLKQTLRDLERSNTLMGQLTS